MSAETLRRAAALMRERAEAARAGRWFNEDERVRTDWSTTREVAVCEGSIPQGNRANAQHIVAWQPEVALLVAELLDSLAAESWCCEECQFGGDVPHPVAALALADLFLDRGGLNQPFRPERGDA